MNARECTGLVSCRATQHRFECERRKTVSSEQQSLVGQPSTLVAGKPLTDRQQAAWDLVRTAPGGMTAEQVGANWHHLKGKHPADRPCVYCPSEGASVLHSVALKTLVIHRRSLGVWEPRDKKDRVSVGVRAGTTRQLAGLPDWLDAA